MKRHYFGIDRLEHAVELNPGGVNGPIRMAVLEKHPETERFSARRLEAGELEEHKQNVRGAYESLRNYRNGIGVSAGTSTEPPPGRPS